MNRRAQSHYELITLFVESIKTQRAFPVEIDRIIPTMQYAQMLSDLIYDAKAITSE